MRKHFCTFRYKVGCSRVLRKLSAILKPTDGSKSFPAKISNQALKQIIKQVVHDWEDCQKSRIGYDRDLPRFSFFPSIPPYKHKIGGRKLSINDNQSIEERGGDKNKGLLNFSQSDIIICPKSQNVIKVRIGLETALYFVETAHQKFVTFVYLNSHLIAGIDLGIDYLVALASNKPTFTPTIYEKKHFQLINQGFNQRRAFFLSKFDGEKSTPRQIQQITFNRNKQFQKNLRLTNSLIVKRLVEEKIIPLIMGINGRDKQSIKLEKNHQDFVTITEVLLTAKNFYFKTELFGIEARVTRVTKAYSTRNKCKFWDLEPVGKQESYQRNRRKSGLFRSLNKRLINADVNAGLKMIIKLNVNSPLEECHNPIDVFAVSPVRVEPARKETQKVG
jgi:putative transposase